MSRPTTPPPLSVTLTVLRSSRGWSQKDLAQVTGIPNSVLSDYEKGRRVLSRQKLDKVAAAMKMGPEAIEMSLLTLGFLQPREESPDSPLGLDQNEQGIVERAAAVAAQELAKTTRTLMTRFLETRKVQMARDEAEKLWERLKRYSPRERRLLVDDAWEFHSWALCERLCSESERAAAADASRALDLADLALRVATRVAGEEGWRSLVQAYAWAFIGNARRVASDLPGAEEAFAHSWKLWKVREGRNFGLLDEGRRFDLAASLKRDQRRLPEALEFHEQALVSTRPEDSGYILLNMAFTLEQLGDFERAIDLLKQAASVVKYEGEPRLLCVLRFNLAVNLSQLGKYEEAAILVPEVRSLAIQLSNELDLIRVLWLEARILVGLGKRPAAIASLEQVRTGFIAREISYDAALVSLELAVLYLEDSRIEDVKVLARQMTPIFRAQGVHREALAALKLFCEAAEREAATADLARRLVNFLERARHNVELRFEE